MSQPDRLAEVLQLGLNYVEVPFSGASSQISEVTPAIRYSILRKPCLVLAAKVKNSLLDLAVNNTGQHIRHA